MTRDEYISYWRCDGCCGTGRVIPRPGHAASCPKCDGTGNALIDVERRKHERALFEIDLAAIAKASGRNSSAQS